MAENDTIIITSAGALRRAARGVVARIKKNEGNINPNGVLAEIAVALAGERQTWGGIIQHPVFASPGIRMKSVGDQSPQKKQSNNSPKSKPDFECFVPVADVSRSKMLKLAVERQAGTYEYTDNENPICAFENQDVFEPELVSLADLLTAMECNTDPIFRDSAYMLLRRWGNTREDSYKHYPTEFISRHIRRMIFEISYSVPIDRGNQIQLILQTWRYLKFPTTNNSSPRDKWELLAQELGWIESDEDVALA